MSYKILDPKNSFTETATERSSWKISLRSITQKLFYLLHSYKGVLSAECPNWPSWGFRENMLNQIHSLNKSNLLMYIAVGSESPKTKPLLHFDLIVRVRILRNRIKYKPFKLFF